MPESADDPYRLFAVSYLNSRTLLYGLDADPRLRLELAVPSALLGLIGTAGGDRRAAALLPVIDIPRLPRPTVICSGGIGCDGPTLTVRVFSRVPWANIRTLAADADSHTSVALARILLAERAPAPAVAIVPRVAASASDADATLLIGDKVITHPCPPGDFQYDLGEEWHHLTGLPFVFAVWTSQGAPPPWLPDRLARARREGREQLARVVREESGKYGWPPVLAMHYLGTLLRFEIGPKQLQAIRLFHSKAKALGLLPQDAADFAVAQPSPI